MNGTRVGPLTVSNARAFYGSTSFYAATGWIPVVMVAGEIRAVLRLTTIDDPQSAGYQVTLAVQLATTDPNDPDDWAEYTTTSTIYADATDPEKMIRIAPAAAANITKFWIRLGVAASLAGGTGGEIATGDVSFILAAASA